MPESDFLAALGALHQGGVKFVAVGGLAVVLNGAPVPTCDVDTVPKRDEENLAKLLRVLGSLGHNLITRCGPLDVLGTIGRGWSYEDLLPNTIEMEIGGGV
jgi:hypothetical protein